MTVPRTTASDGTPSVADGHISGAAPGRSRFGLIWRLVGAAFFVSAGANHFRNPTMYRQIMPPSIPNPHAMVVISGIAEIVGGLGLLSCRLRQPTRWGLIALLVAIFPANIYMAMHPERTEAREWPSWIVWARLPLQGFLIWWVWWMTREQAYPQSMPRERV